VDRTDLQQDLDAPVKLSSLTLDF